MNALLIYLFKAIAIQAILYLIYILVFHKSGRHAVNRYYVILALALSFLIPFISISIPPDKFPEDVMEAETPVWYEITELTTGKTELIPVRNDNQANLEVELVFMGIIFISLLLLLKLVYSHFQLLRLKRKSERIIIDGRWIYCSNIESPFSYFGSIFIPKSILKSSSFDTILRHELVHVNKRHSVDRIILEVILALFWFNPFHYLFKSRLIEIHEFQADEEVIKIQNDPIHYQEVLYQQINSQYAVATANHFKLNTIKTRIKMINQNKKLSKWHYMLILPALALMTFAFANKEDITSETLEVEIDDIFEEVAELTDLYTPSIMPVKETDLVRVTSGFGVRLHPILKEERMHEGVDFSIPVGKEVIATANGTVKKVNKSDKGFGNYLSIDHNGGYQTFYAQLSEINVKAGQLVKRGEVIALTGNSGSSTEPHLHYEVRDAQGNFLNPLDFIKLFDFKKQGKLGDSNNSKFGKPNQKLKVVIDPGHGGDDEGMASFHLKEKEVNLKVAKAVADNFINSNDVEIILSRKTDETKTLEERVKLSEKADLLISLHVETHEYEKENRMVAIYNDQNDHASQSKYFSEILSQELRNIDKTLRVGYSSGFYILKNAKCPAVLFSMGYFSNPESEEYLNSDEGMKEIAQELSDAIKASL